MKEQLNNTESSNSTKPVLSVVVDSAQSLLDFLKTKNCTEFTSKNMCLWIKEDFGNPKTHTTKLIQELKEKGVLERRSRSTNCTTICSSCYEYGCDADPTPPYNYWKILRWVV